MAKRGPDTDASLGLRPRPILVRSSQHLGVGWGAFETDGLSAPSGWTLCSEGAVEPEGPLCVLVLEKGRLRLKTDEVRVQSSDKKLAPRALGEDTGGTAPS